MKGSLIANFVHYHLYTILEQAPLIRFLYLSRNDSGVFNAFLTYFAAESGNQKGQSAEEEQAVETSKQVIDDCDLDSVIDDTKFLRTSSLQVCM